MDSRRWINTSQPQTLQIAVFLLYMHAVFLLILGGGVFSLIGLLLGAAMVGGGYGVANEQKWGYGLAIAVSVLPFVLILVIGGIRGLLNADPLSLMFDIALVALLVHPQSREYQRIWFK